MSHAINYRRVIAEICVGPANDRPLNVGLIAMPRKERPDVLNGWLEFTPAEARDLAEYLRKAADEAEAAS